jgi:hypothetical protein
MSRVNGHKGMSGHMDTVSRLMYGYAQIQYLYEGCEGNDMCQAGLATATAWTTADTSKDQRYTLYTSQAAVMGSLLQLSDVADLIPRQDAEFFKGRVADLLERQSRTFPGAQPVSFSRRHLRELQETEYALP